MNVSNKVFGIDLGTTYSCIAYVDEYGQAVVANNTQNEPTTPSVVYFAPGKIVIGEVAKENTKLHPEDVVSFVKRSMGDSYYLFEHDGQQYKPEEISAYILKKLVQDAEQKLNEKITDVVITCPAYFGINEREATRKAGEIAGLNVRQILNEPTAAAIYYGMTDNSQDKVVLVYDLGGGTFDITMIGVSPNEVKVICTGGNHRLGGKDWDDAMIDYFGQQVKEQTGQSADFESDPDLFQELQLLAERTKKSLSSLDPAPVAFYSNGKKIKIELSQAKFDEISNALLENTIELTHAMLQEAAKKGVNGFDEILLVGGSTRMPQVAQRIKEEFNIEPKLLNPDEAVAQGAALYGWKLTIDDELIRRIAQEMGKDVEEVKEMKPEEIPVDIIETATVAVAGETGLTIGAVKKAAIGIVDVSCKSFGVVAFNEQEVEQVFNLIVRFTEVPAEITKRFGTHEADQESVDLRIMENETSDKDVPLTNANEIGTAVLEIPPGLPQNSPLDITFKLNKDGRLEVTAVEATEQRTIKVTIETTSVISGEELKQAKARSQAMNCI